MKALEKARIALRKHLKGLSDEDNEKLRLELIDNIMEGQENKTYTNDQIEGALLYGFQLSEMKHTSIERFSDNKIQYLMKKYIDDLDNVNSDNNCHPIMHDANIERFKHCTICGSK